MNALIKSLSAVILAEDKKNIAREDYRVARPGDLDYDARRIDFRLADDEYETAASVVITVVQDLMAEDALSAALGELSELATPFALFAESRGITHLIAEDGNGLAQMSKRWKNVGDRMTAFKQINIFRRDLIQADFEETIFGSSPSNVDSAAWDASIKAFNLDLEEFNRKTNYSVDLAEAMREVAFDLEHASRRAYDTMTEKYVEVLRGLQNSGRLESEMAELDPALLSVVRAGIVRMPQPQLQPQAVTVKRSALVL